MRRAGGRCSTDIWLLTHREATTYDLTGCLDVSTDAGIETRADQAAVRIEKRNMPSFAPEINDNIKIYLGSGNVQPTEQIMDAMINTFKYTSDEKGHNYTFNCLNRLEALLTNLRPAAFSAVPASEAVTEIINWANYFNSGATNWNYIQTGSISTTTKKINYYTNYRNLFQQIEELSTDDYTGNGTYNSYLNNSNYFVWGPRSSTNAGTLYEANCQSVQIEKGTWDVVNALIINGGDDLNGASIMGIAVNLVSYGKIGGKWKFIVRKSYAEEYKSQHPGATNDEVRAGVREMIMKRGKVIVDILGSPRYKAELEVDGTNKYTMGGLWTLVIPSFPGWVSTGKQLRMTELNHKYGKTGWTTILRFEEDEETAQAGLL